MNGTKSIKNGMPSDLRAHRIIAGAVLAASLVLYFSTIAPTTSFWDCGEFIASSYSLGVPHPPGAPFFLLLGRIFSMVPFNPDIGFRVNSISVIVSSLTILLTYLIIVRLIRLWRGPENTVTDKVVMYGASAVAALGFAGSHSFWFNAVEAEVYAISMFFTAMVIWLILRWIYESDSPNATKYLLLIAYLIGLSTGVHLLNVLALSPIVLLIYFQKYRFTWKGFWFALSLSFFAILVVYPGIVAGIPKLIEKGVYALVIVVVLLAVGLFYSVRRHGNVSSVVFASILLVMMGYSTYGVIYIRANQNPVINENQPDTVERLISYLNREQYGSAGPIEIQNLNYSLGERVRRAGGKFIRISPNKVLRFNIFERKAPLWEYQIKKMYIRYLSWQYFIGERGQAFLFPFIFGAIGVWWHFRRDPKRAFSILMLFLMTGLAIVAYLNQDDPQPRERDYAYVGSYFAFALWIGIGIVGVFESIEELLEKKGEKIRRAFAYGTIGLAAVTVPANLVAQNYHTHNRSGNYVAWDYSYNMLESCEPNGIMFTNGDNDTFPLWYLQVVEKIRPDVRVVNLSLLNTEWYIKQLRDMDPKVPITLSDQFIDEKLCGRTDEALLLRYWPNGEREYSIPTPKGELKWNLPATIYINTGLPNETPGKNNFLRIQDVMILHIIEQAKWQRPIYFAVTVSTSNLLNLGPYLSMEGLVFRLMPEKVTSEINEPLMRKHLFETFKDHYRNLNNPKVYFFPNILKLLQNYRSGFLQLVYDYYSKARATDWKATSGIPEEQWADRFDDLTYREKALFTLQKMEQIMPEEVIPLRNRDILLQLGRIYSDLGRPDQALIHFQRSMELPGSTLDDSIQAAFYILEYTDAKDEGVAVLKRVLESNPTVDQLFNVAAIYDRAKMKDDLKKTLDLIEARQGLSYSQQLDLATYYLNSEEYLKARGIFEALSQQNPNDGAARGGLLQVYTAMKDTPRAVELLEDWVKLNPTDENARTRLQQWKK